MVSGICKLCLETRALQRSHIIPEVMWRLVYDPSHRAVLVPSPQRGRPRGIQKGLRERLLCLDCERHIARWETYASRVFFDEERFPPEISRQTYLLRGVDYPRFKLFLMSLLWRAGVSELETFEEVDLGPHESRLRHMLLTADPGEPHDYPCIVIIPEAIPQFVARAIWPPRPFRANGLRCVRFIIGGYLWCFVTAKHAKSVVPLGSILTADGNLPLLRDFDRSADPIFEQLWRGMRALKTAHDHQRPDA